LDGVSQQASAVLQQGPDGEIGRRSGLKIVDFELIAKFRGRLPET